MKAISWFQNLPFELVNVYRYSSDSDSDAPPGLLSDSGDDSGEDSADDGGSTGGVNFCVFFLLAKYKVRSYKVEPPLTHTHAAGGCVVESARLALHRCTPLNPPRNAPARDVIKPGDGFVSEPLLFFSCCFFSRCFFKPS
jgi:hypothetical protein